MIIINKPGRPSLQERKNIKEKIINIIKMKGVINPESIRKNYIENYNEGKNVSWLTIRRYLNILKEESKIDEKIITQGTRRKISVIRIAK